MTNPSSEVQGWRGQLRRTLVYFGLAEDQRDRSRIVHRDEAWFLIFFLPALMAAVVGANRSATAGWIALAGFAPTTLLSVAIKLRLIGGEYRALADTLAVPAVMFAATIWLAPQEMGWPTIVAIAAAVTAALFLFKFTRRSSEGLRNT